MQELLPVVTLVVTFVVTLAEAFACRFPGRVGWHVRDYFAYLSALGCSWGQMGSVQRKKPGGYLSRSTGVTSARVTTRSNSLLQMDTS